MENEILNSLENELLKNNLSDSQIDSAALEELPIPDEFTEEQRKALQSTAIDNNLYPYRELMERILSGDFDKKKVPTFFKPIDNLIDGGFHGGELIILSGLTKQGKTSACQTFSFLQAKNNIPALWFTFEMSWQELTKKFYEMDKSDAIVEGRELIEPTPLPIFYPIDNRLLSLEWLDKQIGFAKKDLDIKMVYIDHLHFLLPLNDSVKNVSFVIGGIVRELKKIAVRHDLPIMLIAHTKKLTDAEEVPDITSVRDSSFIVQESDHTIIVYRERKKRERKSFDDQEFIDEDVYTKFTYFAFEANRRNGNTKRFRVQFIGGRFYPIEEAGVAEMQLAKKVLP